MAPDEIIDPPPTWARQAWVAGTPPRDMNAARRACGASTHTPPKPHPDRTVTTDSEHRGPLLFGAEQPCDTTTPEHGYRIGWSLVLMCTAETIVFLTAVASANYVTGLVAVSAMALCGVILVASETATRARGAGR